MRVVLIRLFRLQRLLHIACIQMQSRVQCVLSNGLRKKLLNYKDVRENICVGGDVLLSVPAGSDLGKSLTFEFAPCVYDFLPYGQRQEISPIYLVVVPLIAR